MPKRKRSSLGSSTARADKLAHQRARAAEDAEQRERRQRSDAATHQRSRAEESPERRELRQRSDAAAHQRSRVQESTEAKRARQRTDREATASATAAINSSWLKAAFAYDLNKDYTSNPKVSIGRMDNICRHCSAKKWPGEAPGMCCTGGKVKLEALQMPPEVLRQLLSEDSPRAKHFRDKIGKYNAAFMMTSFGADKNLTDHGFFTTYKIQGQCYHRMGSLLPLQDEEPKYVQVFFMGGDDEAMQRCRLNRGVQQDIIEELQAMLHATHPYVASFKFALEHIETSGAPILLMRNLDAPKLCIGTRLTVKQLMPRVIEATIMTGKGKGENVFIPKIPLIPSDLPFQFKRLQFPVKLSFAMSTNKAQGQSLKVVGLK